ETAELWNRVTSTRENCLGQECPFVKDCFVLKARRRAQDADIVVINHALYMADLALRGAGAGALLPESGVVVFDEAHQVPEVATRFLGDSVSSWQLLEAAQGARGAGNAHAPGTAPWDALTQGLETATRELRLQAAGVERLPGRRATRDRLPDAPAIEDRLDTLIASIGSLLDALGSVAEAHPDLNAAAQTVLGLHERLSAWCAPDEEGAEAVRWLELSQKHLRLHRAPLRVASMFTGQRPDEQAWIFTSATLSLKGDFSHFQQQLGLDDAAGQCWESPFDYARQALLYVPENLPLPSHPGFTDAFVEVLYPLVRQVQGGVMVLCTTLRAVERIAGQLADRLAQEGSERLVLQQGEQARGV